MSTSGRKILYVDGNPLEVTDDIDVDKGDLEGEEVMSTTGYAGMKYKPTPGRVAAKVIYNPNLDKSLWDKGVKRSLLVEYPDIGQGTGFDGMDCKSTFKVEGETVAIEFVGPKGYDVQ